MAIPARFNNALEAKSDSGRKMTPSSVIGTTKIDTQGIAMRLAMGADNDPVPKKISVKGSIPKDKNSCNRNNLKRGMVICRLRIMRISATAEKDNQKLILIAASGSNNRTASSATAIIVEDA